MIINKLTVTLLFVILTTIGAPIASKSIFGLFGNNSVQEILSPFVNKTTKNQPEVLGESELRSQTIETAIEDQTPTTVPTASVSSPTPTNTSTPTPTSTQNPTPTPQANITTPSPTPTPTIRPNPVGVTLAQFEKVPNARNNQPSQTAPVPTTTVEKAPSATPTSTPTPSPSLIPTPTPSYQDLHCPKVVRIEDNLGNVSSGVNLKGTFKKGSINLLTVKITATDPQDLPLHYQYSYSYVTSHNPYLGNWSTNNTYNVDVTNAYVGSNRVLFAGVDNQDGYGCSGAYYDNSIQFNYDITP